MGLRHHGGASRSGPFVLSIVNQAAFVVASAYGRLVDFPPPHAMTLFQLVSILRARWTILVSVLAVFVGGAVIVSLLLPKQYTATATVVVDVNGMDPVLGIFLPVQLMPGYIATQMDIIKSKRVAMNVVGRLRLANVPAARQKWQSDAKGNGTFEDYWSDLLLRKLDVKPSRESSVVAISFTGDNPENAAAVANAFAEEYQRVSLSLRVEPARQSAAFFDEQLGSLRKRLEEAQTRLSDYQRKAGFTATDERLDLENARLQELSAQYSLAQGQNADSQSRLRQLTEFLARGASPETLPDVLANALIQTLKNQLNQTEGRLEQVSSQLGGDHPEVKRLQADISSQRAKLRTEITSAASAIRNTAAIAQRREADLREQLAQQKTKLLASNQNRDQFMVLVKEVDNAQKAFDVASQRFQTTKLESQTSLTNISVLSPALPPVRHSFPLLLFNLLLALIGGTLVGIAAALLVETANRRVRSVTGLRDALGVPVLAAMLDDRPVRMRVRRLGFGEPGRSFFKPGLSFRGK